MSGSGTGPLAPEVLVPRLGEYLVENHLITREQLAYALKHQVTIRQTQGTRLIGQILVDLGYISRETLDAATTELLIQLRSALEEANQQLEQRVKERTAELETALHQLSSLNELKANLVANISHELRTPLTHLTGYLDLLINGDFGPLTADQLASLEIVQRSSERLGNLIEDLIQFSQAARGQMTLTLEPVDLKKVVSKVIASLKSRADDRQMTLEEDLDPQLPCVQADEEKLSWVITQLMDNAIKFTNPGGKVNLKIVKDVAARNMVTISVADNGIGISKDRIKEIFEPFHQLDGSSTRRYGGTGLGLSLVLQIIEAHGSLINVQSEVDQGTTISFPMLIAKEE